MSNRVVITFESQSHNEAFARSAVGAYLAPLDPSMEELDDIKTAVSEAVTNAIVHGYPSAPGEICMTLEQGEDRTIEISVKDTGVGIPNVTEARQPLFTTGGEERSGMGFTIMERFMTRLHVESVPGKGTVVYLYKTLRPKGDG